MRKNPLRSLLFLTTAAAALAGCSHGAGVYSSLPVQRVVIYRNGVGYFERGGQVRDDQVQFQVRPSHIDDFLATLTVMEAGGSSVQSASFPMRVDAPPPGDKPADTSQTLDTVTLHLDGKSHDLTVGYVAEQPIWRPSYRLVLENHQLSLQAWGIVQNLSGEDWNQVQLSLVAGAPIAFQSTLSRPVTPARPVVSDTGELISAVPQSESSLAQLEPGAPPPPVQAPAAAAPMMGELREEESSNGPAASRSANMARPSRAMKKERSRSPVGGAYAGKPMGSAIPSERNRALLASTAVTAGSTRYDLPMPVTVPDKSATLVLLSALSVPGEAVHMFAPDPGVPDSSLHPFRVARFKNITAGLLERGPIAVVESGAFLGQGVLEPLSAGSEATVPFALDRGVAVDTENNVRLVGARVSQIEAGNLTIERDRVWETTYRVRNGEAESVKVVVRHPRHAGTRLEKPPAGTEDQVGKNSALAPVQVKARETAELHLEEHEPVAQAADWMSDEANEAMQELFADKSADAATLAVIGVLKEAWTTRESLRKHQEENEKVSAEKEILHRAAEESRENLRALQRNPARGVSELRDKLAQRLLGMDNRLAELSKRLVELQLKISEESVRFREAVRDLKLVRPRTRGTSA